MTSSRVRTGGSMTSGALLYQCIMGTIMYVTHYSLFVKCGRGVGDSWLVTPGCRSVTDGIVLSEWVSRSRFRLMAFFLFFSTKIISIFARSKMYVEWCNWRITEKINVGMNISFTRRYYRLTVIIIDKVSISIYPSIHPSISIYLSIYLSVYLSIYLSIYLSVYLSIYLYTQGLFEMSWRLRDVIASCWYVPWLQGGC